MFGLGKLLYVIILTVNGIAVLSEDRFLNRIGWNAGSSAGPQSGAGGSGANDYMTGAAGGFNQADNYSIKSRLINLIGAIRTLLRVPLIVINVVVILYELILG